MLAIWCIFGVLGMVQVESFIPNRREIIVAGTPQKPGLHDMLIKTMHNTVNYLGFGLKCKNGGVLSEENKCICTSYFKGIECETRICINGGVIMKHGKTFLCKCPEHIHGEHCEDPRCQNGGIQRGDKTGNWSCDCSNLYLHNGKFCEVLNTPSLPVFAAGFVLLILLLFCICNMNCCKKRTRSRGFALENDRRREMATARRTGQTDLSSDDGLLTNTRIRRTPTAYPPTVVQQYVVRLDTIPTFNPGMIGGVESEDSSQQQSQQTAQPLGPPPSYDQISSIPHCQPPEYTPNDTNNKL